MLCCARRRTRSSRARTNSAGCCRARKARRWPKASARRCAPPRSSISSRARRCGWPARRCPACGPASASRSRASRSASSASSRRGTSRSPFPPGRSRRRSATAIRWCSSRPISCRAAPGRSSTSCIAPDCRRACSTWSWARVRWSARRCSTVPMSMPSPSPARSARASASPPPVSSTCASSSSKWAARTRLSCSTMPISASLSNARSMAPSSPPASAARPRRG